jgi:hypothetical protein
VKKEDSENQVDPAAPVKPPPHGPLRKYLQNTRTWTYSFLAVLPLLCAYEILILTFNRSEVGTVRIGADVLIKQVLATIGGTWHLSLGSVVLLIGVFVLLAERRKRIDISIRYMLWMLAESAVYAIVLGGLVSIGIGKLFSYLPMADTNSDFSSLSFGLQLALAIGAGLYEEMVFRVVVVGSLLRIALLMINNRAVAYIPAALIGAFVFSLVHYIGAMGDDFNLQSFTFRFVFGLALNFLYLLRGFGIAAWTHSLYDIGVVIILALR